MSLEQTEELVSEQTIKLEQNYPNPFTELTEIKFLIPKNGFVAISIYSVDGRRLKDIVHTNHLKGNHSIIFKNHNLKQGIYFYSLEFNNQHFFSLLKV